MATANGWTLINPPSFWSFVQMDWKQIVPTASNASFAGQSQVFKWPGADRWAVTVTLPPLTDDQAREWDSFVWQCQGGAVAFPIGNPLRRKPKGSAKAGSASGIVVSGTNTAIATTLNLRGFLASTPRVLSQGDHISVNHRLYQVLDSYVNADSSGHAVVSIAPSLREAVTDGMPVTTHDATGMFRLKSPTTSFSIDGNRLYSLSLQCVEAR